MFGDAGGVIVGCWGEVIHGKFERLPPNAASIPANGHGKHHSKQLIKKRKMMIWCTSRDTSQIEVVTSC